MLPVTPKRGSNKGPSGVNTTECVCQSLDYYMALRGILSKDVVSERGM